MVVYEEFEIKTGGRLDMVDITEEVLSTATASAVRNGNVLVFSPHTTCCVVIGANGARTVQSFANEMEAIAPSDAYYAHDDLSIRTENLVEDEPPNAPAHLFHIFAGRASETIPVIDGELALGSDQRVLFVELDSSRLRRFCIQVVGE